MTGPSHLGLSALRICVHAAGDLDKVAGVVGEVGALARGGHEVRDHLGLAEAVAVDGDRAEAVAQMALDYAQPGDVIVIDGAGYADRALVGGMMLAYAEERGLAGFVVNGALEGSGKKYQYNSKYGYYNNYY